MIELKDLSEEARNSLVKEVFNEIASLMLTQKEDKTTSEQLEDINENERLKNASKEELIHMLIKAEKKAMEESNHVFDEPLMYSSLKTWHDKALEDRELVFTKLYDNVMGLFISDYSDKKERVQAEEVFNQSKQLMINFANKLYKVQTVGFAAPSGPYKIFHVYNENDYNIYKNILEQVSNMFLNICLSSEKKGE